MRLINIVITIVVHVAVRPARGDRGARWDHPTSRSEAPRVLLIEGSQLLARRRVRPRDFPEVRRRVRASQIRRAAGHRSCARGRRVRGRLALVEAVRRRGEIRLGELAGADRSLRRLQQGLDVGVGFVARAPDFVALVDDAAAHVDALVDGVAEDALDGPHEIGVAGEARFEGVHLLVGETPGPAESRGDVLNLLILRRHDGRGEIFQKIQQAPVECLRARLMMDIAKR